MKHRITITILLLAIIIITMPLAIIFFNAEALIIYSVSTAVITGYVLLYLFAGLPKLLIYGIYGLIILGFLILLPDYSVSISIIGAILFILNPLAAWEARLHEKLPAEDTLPLRITLRKRYWPFYAYRKEMTNYYYLPQAKKLFTNKWYLYSRKIFTFFLIGLGLFLMINELSNVVVSLMDYNLISIIIFYVVIATFILTFTLYKKGYSAMFRLALSLLFIPILTFIILADLNIILQIILSATTVTLGISYIIYDIFTNLNKVVYSSYHYYDPDTKEEVFANALYEPLVYNEPYNLVGIYIVKISLSKFHKLLKGLLFSANCRKFIITAYTHDGEYLKLYTEFQEKDSKKAYRLVKYLEKLFEAPVLYDIAADKLKKIYETKFFHRTEYIVARAISLAELLLELSVETQIVISMIYTFSKISDIENFQKDKRYTVTRLPDLDTDDQYCVRVSVKSVNYKYQIEQNVRDMLLAASLYDGSYIRIVIYY